MSIRKHITSVITIVLLLAAHTAAAQTGKNTTTDWDAVIDAIIAVESEGDTQARSGNSVGAMQITPVLVAECNDILRREKSPRRYSLADRTSLRKSKEMFRLIQRHHNPEGNIERAIRAWNGGPRYSVRATNRYYRKVMQHLTAAR